MLRSTTISILNEIGGYYSSRRFARLLGLSDTEINDLRLRLAIIGLPLADGSYVYPTWQFVRSWWGGHELLFGLDRVLAALDDPDPWVQTAFMLDCLVSTELTSPLDGLRQGKIDLVVATAKSFRNQGAV